ncbi:secreted glucosidase, partial [Fusarium flagelliforme]
MRLFLISILLSLAALAATEQAPGYEGFDLIWEDTFSGPAGSLPDQSKWIMQDWYKNLNGDFQTYTTSRANQQHTGHGSLVIIPLRDPSAQRGWTSGRLESTYTFTPAPGAKTIAEAQIKLGGASKSGKQGIWPAFWLLGDSHRKGTLIWPTCGEIDILENVNGEPKTQGVIHCDKNPGGICNEKNGIASALDLPDSGRNFHTYTAMIDRTPGDWRQESVSLFVDGRQYHRATGARIGNEEVWGKVAHNLVHFILNVAVGGEWPGDPNGSTVSGIGNAMEVKYVAHYQSQGAGGSRPPSHGSGGYDPIPQPQPQPGPQYPEPPAPPHEHIPQPPSPYYPYDPAPSVPGPYGPPYEQAPDYPWEQPPRRGRPKVPKPHSPYVPYDPVPEPPSPHYPYDPEPPSHRRPKEDYDHDSGPGYPEEPAY